MPRFDLPDGWTFIVRLRCYDYPFKKGLERGAFGSWCYVKQFQRFHIRVSWQLTRWL